jgi:hypothetical protein
MSYLLTVPRAAKGPGPGLAGLLRGLGPVPQWRGRGLGQDDSGGDFADVIGQSDVNSMLTSSPDIPTLDNPFSTSLLSAPGYSSIFLGNTDLSALDSTLPASVGSAPSSSGSSASSLLNSLSSVAGATAKAVSSASPPPGVTSAQWSAMTAAQQAAYLDSLNTQSQFAAGLSSFGTYFTASTLWPPLPNWAVLGGGAVAVFLGIVLIKKAGGR